MSKRKSELNTDDNFKGKAFDPFHYVEQNESRKKYCRGEEDGLKNIARKYNNKNLKTEGGAQEPH